MADDNDEVLKIAPTQELIRLDAPEGCTSISVAGTEYKVGEGQTIEVTPAIAGELQSHGFTPSKPYIPTKKAEGDGDNNGDNTGDDTGKVRRRGGGN